MMLRQNETPDLLIVIMCFLQHQQTTSAPAYDLFAALSFCTIAHKLIMGSLTTKHLMHSRPHFLSCIPSWHPALQKSFDSKSQGGNSSSKLVLEGSFYQSSKQSASQDDQEVPGAPAARCAGWNQAASAWPCYVRFMHMTLCSYIATLCSKFDRS